MGRKNSFVHWVPDQLQEGSIPDSEKLHLCHQSNIDEGWSETQARCISPRFIDKSV